MAPRFKGLTQDEIEKLMNDLDSENIADSDSDCEDSTENSSFQDISEITENEILEDDPTVNVSPNFNWRDPETSDTPIIYPFTGKTGIKFDEEEFQNELDYFKLFFSDKLLQVLTDETNRYATQFYALRPVLSSKKSHSTEWTPTCPKEIIKFLGLILLMGHVEKDSIQEYWSTDELVETPIFRKVMPRDRFKMILKFLHFSNNSDKLNRDNPFYDRLWKIREIFDMINESYKEAYNPAENLAIDEVIVKFKGRVIFRQYIPKKRKQWGIKIYKIADELGYTYDMQVYLGKDKNEEKPFCSAAFNVVTEMAKTIKGKGHKLFMDNFFSSPDLYDFLHSQMKVNCCGTVRQNRKKFPKDMVKKKMARGSVTMRFAHGMTAVCWKDKREVLMLSNMHLPSDQVVKTENTGKPQIVADYNKHMGYVDLSDRMANSYSFGRRTLKWTKKIFFHLLDLSVLNAYLLVKNKHTSHKDFRMKLIKLMLNPTEFIYSSPSTSKSSFEHWPLNTPKRRRCSFCSQKGLQRRSRNICESCNVALCTDRDCFKEYHNKRLKK